MDFQFDRQGVIRISDAMVVFGLICLCALSTAANNNFWLGHIQNLKVCQSDDNTILLSVAVQEYIAEGIFGEFDETKIVYMNKSSDLLEWTIYLDNIAPGDFAGYQRRYSAEEMLFWQSISVSSQQGGFTDPNRTQTAEGKPITTAKLILTGYKPIYIYLDSVDKDNPSEVLLFFKITDQIPEQQLSSKKNGNTLEICITDFDRDQPIGNFMSKIDPKRLTPKTREYIKRLQEMPEGTFVTLIYQVKYQDVHTLKRQLDKIKSELGEVESIEDNAQIMIRDRSEYVLEMLQLLLAIDVPVPQVIIDVQIIERNVQDGHEFSSSFHYLHDDPKRDFDGACGTPGAVNLAPLVGDHISGVYQHLDGEYLNRFQYQINMEIQRGRSRMKASTRIMCKNRESAQFNSGNKIPYYQFNEYDYKDRDYQYDTEEQTKSGSEDPSVFPSYSNRDFGYKERDIDTTRNWELKFIDTGVNLWIKPYIKNSEWVELELKPSYSEITGIGSYSQVPILANRSLDTTVTVKNGDTFLLAGLLYEKELEAVKGVPILMDIPLIGRLFSTDIHQKQQTEIIFVLTVYIHYPK